MDRSITADEASERFPDVLRDVARGESFVVTSQGRPVARLTPMEEAGEREGAPGEDLAAQAKAVEELLAHVATLPRRRLNWRREDLYE